MLNGIRPDDDDLITMDGVINEDGTKTIALLWVKDDWKQDVIMTTAIVVTMNEGIRYHSIWHRLNERRPDVLVSMHFNETQW